MTDAAITLNYYSHQLNPVGYPHWFAYAAGATGFTSVAGSDYRYNIIGSSISVRFYAEGTSNATTVTFIIPVKTTHYENGISIGNSDAGSGVTTVGRVAFGAASATVNCYKDGYLGAWTNSGNKAVNTVTPFVKFSGI